MMMFKHSEEGGTAKKKDQEGVGGKHFGSL